MQRRHAVRIRRRPQRERRQAEALLIRPDLAEREELVPAEPAARDEPRDVLPHELRIELLVTRGHRRVRREDGGRTKTLERFLRPEPCGRELAPTLELEKRRVPFVEMEDRRREPELAQDAHAADAEQQLLAQPGGPVATVERVGHRPLRIALDMRVDEGKAIRDRPSRAIRKAARV